MSLMDGLQWRGNHDLAKAIRFITKEDVNHTSAVIIFKEYDRVFSVEAELKRGLDLYPLSNILSEYDGEVWWYPLKEEYKEVSHEAADWLLQRVGVTGYNVRGCLSNIYRVFGKKVSRQVKGSLYCSESYFFSWKKGAKLKHLRNVKYVPVPGKDMENLNLWEDGIKIIGGTYE